MSVLNGSRVVVGVTGGIAAYKAADFVSKLVQAGALVDVILTESAERFVGPVTFRALTKRAVYSTVFDPWTETSLGHITLGHEADAIVVIPATAQTIARLATGLADDMLGAAVLSSRAPLLIVPSMEHDMYRHPATQANLNTLTARGASVVGPESGRLASGEYGEGRMSSPETVVGALRQSLGQAGSLAGKRVVISAGGTREPFDPIRYIGNRSSGRMGYALAQSAVDHGAVVTLVSAAVELPAPYGVELILVQTAEEMSVAVNAAVATADVLIMAAAVADFRPAAPQSNKIKKRTAKDAMTVDLVRTPDILSGIARSGLLKVGFAAETSDLIEYATAKLHSKNLAMIVANDAESTIGGLESTAHLIFAGGGMTSLPRLPKTEVADRVITEIAQMVTRSVDA